MTTPESSSELLVNKATKSKQPAPWLCQTRTVAVNSNQIAIRLYKADELSVDQKEWIYQLVKNNMRSMYMKADWGWDSREKQAELFHDDSRFIIAESSESIMTMIESSQEVEQIPVAFTMFRFDTEEQMTSDDMIPVLYCYELQVMSSIQGQGIGRVLMQELEKIARQWHMVKIMLTVLKVNKAAHTFYQRLGFQSDEISPENILTRHQAKRISYQILSKCLLNTIMTSNKPM
ncbi:acyl-CoA N-acyltransferase [Syncephalis plumigaleata]|nr:acyl-CoA N-acyltransferase [Syncephalis plumigaleata]